MKSTCSLTIRDSNKKRAVKLWGRFRGRGVWRTAWMLVAVQVCWLTACAARDEQNEPPVAAYWQNQSSEPACLAASMRYPTTASDFKKMLYGYRGFLTVYQGYKHLGHDIVYTEGTAIHPLSCGVIRFYGPATGYGSLAAVVEHKLERPLSAENGEGEQVTFSSFLTIYGHLRKTSSSNGGEALPWKIGDTIKPTDTIGFIQSDAANGDGPEHLHLGIRLQSMAAAQAVDSAWFRGNDSYGEGAYKRYYTDPAAFIPNMEMFLEGNEFGEGDPRGSSMANNHPVGTLLRGASGGPTWMVVSKGHLLDVSSYTHLPFNCAVVVAEQALDCYEPVVFDPVSLELNGRVIKFQGEPQVYKLYPGAGFTPSAFQVFLSYDAFLSWGYKDQDIQTYALSQKIATLGQLQDKGGLGLRPGSLVKGQGQSEVSVAHQSGKRRPIFNWDVFEELGYDADCVYEIEPSTLDLVAGVRSEQVITLDETRQCSVGQATTVCAPGTYTVCDCAGGQIGSRSCKTDGSGYEDCVCPVVEQDAGVLDSGQSEAGLEAGSSPCGGWCGAGTHCDEATGNCVLNEQDASADVQPPPVEQCNGLDDDSDGQADETFTCVSGEFASCLTTCQSPGVRRCHLTLCVWEDCRPAYAEICANGADEDCNGLVDCQDPACVYEPACLPAVDAGTPDSGSVVDSGTVLDAGVPDTGSWDSGPTSACQIHGLPGQMTFVVQAPVVSPEVISVFGWIDYPGWSGIADAPWSGWSWGAPGMPELVFQKGGVYQGTKFVFAPGVSSSAGQAQKAWYCDQSTCPVGSYIMCAGQQEVCRVQNGWPSGGASYVPNSSGWQNIQCLVP